MSNLYESAWEDVKNTANNILYTYRPNNKNTFKNFSEWTEYDKRFINDLSAVLGYKENMGTNEQLIKKYIDIFKVANDFFHQYNARTSNSSEKLEAYDLCIQQAIKIHYPEFNDQVEKLKKRYRTYRGMSKLKAYQGNLLNEDLLERTSYMIKVDQFHDFINNPTNRIETQRNELLANYKKQLQRALS